VLIRAEDYGVLLVRSREAMTWRGSGGQSWWGLAERWRTTVLRHSLLESVDCCHPMAPWRVTEDVRDKGARVCVVGDVETLDTRDWRC